MNAPSKEMNILICAFRYALAVGSSAPITVSDFAEKVKEDIKDIDTRTLQQMVEEIIAEDYNRGLGEYILSEVWARMVGCIYEELYTRRDYIHEKTCILETNAFDEIQSGDNIRIYYISGDVEIKQFAYLSTTHIICHDSHNPSEKLADSCIAIDPKAVIAVVYRR